MRFQIYKQNVAEIKKHNSDPSQTYKKGENQFTDLTTEEFQRRYLSSSFSIVGPPKKYQVKDKKSSIGGTSSSIIITLLNPPKPIDWRIVNKTIGAIKNQGDDCGSCWAFATIGSIEANYFIYRQKRVILSEQQLVDCCNGPKYPYTDGCRGTSSMNEPFDYSNNVGLILSTDYPYKAYQQKCQDSSFTKTKYLDSTLPYIYGKIDSINLQSLVNLGPVTITLSTDGWKFYSSGVLNQCGTTINHAVVLIGYDKNNNWIVRNSWGSTWGDNGYITLAPGNTCNLFNQIFFPRPSSS